MQVNERKEAIEKKKRKAQERLKEGTNNPWLRFRDQQFVSGNFDMKDISDLWNKRKKRMAREAQDAQDRADDLAFNQQEIAEEWAERDKIAEPLREAMRRSGRIAQKKQTGSGADIEQDGEGLEDWLDKHPFIQSLADDTVGAIAVGGLALATGGLSLAEAPEEEAVVSGGLKLGEDALAKRAAQTTLEEGEWSSSKELEPLSSGAEKPWTECVESSACSLTREMWTARGA